MLNLSTVPTSIKWVFTIMQSIIVMIEDWLNQTLGGDLGGATKVLAVILWVLFIAAIIDAFTYGSLFKVMLEGFSILVHASAVAAIVFVLYLLKTQVINK